MLRRNTCQEAQRLASDPLRPFHYTSSGLNPPLPFTVHDSCIPKHNVKAQPVPVWELLCLMKPALAAPGREAVEMSAWDAARRMRCWRSLAR